MPRLLAAGLTLAAITAGCATTKMSAAERAHAEREIAQDEYQRTCGGIDRVLEEAQSGVLTLEELREDLKEVYKRSGGVSPDAVRNALHAMIAAVTQNDGAATALTMEATEMACHDWYAAATAPPAPSTTLS